MKALARALPAFLLSLSLGACFSGLNEADLSDPGIKARIETALQAQPDLDLRYVTLDVHDRVVTVSGLIATFSDKQTIDRIIRKVQGVDQIVLNVVAQE